MRADPAGLLAAAGFARVDIEPYRLRTPFIAFTTQIAGGSPGLTSN